MGIVFTFIRHSFPLSFDGSKMSVNKMQLQILVEKMETCPSIAGGYSKIVKEESASFWENAKTDLNSAGPPTKTVAEWKKVWIDQRRYIRKKAADIHRYREGTAGGPPKKLRLTSTEDRIYELVNMKEAVEGVDESFVFGGCEMNEENNTLEVDKENSTHLEVEIPTTLQSSSKIPPTVTSSRKLFKSKAKENSAVDLIETEIKNQEKIVEKMTDLVDFLKEDKTDTKVYVKRISRSLEKIVELKQKDLELKQKDLYLKEKNITEIKRHHMEKEKLKVREIENQIDENKKLIEIKQIKCSLMGRNPM